MSLNQIGVPDTDDQAALVEALTGVLTKGWSTAELLDPAVRQSPTERPLWTALADLGIDAGQVGLAHAWTKVVEIATRPPREQGEIVKDEGDGGTKLAEFLAARKFL